MTRHCVGCGRFLGVLENSACGVCTLRLTVAAGFLLRVLRHYFPNGSDSGLGDYTRTSFVAPEGLFGGKWLQ